MQVKPILIIHPNIQAVTALKAAFDTFKVANPVHVTQDGKEAVEYLAGSGRYARRQPPTLLILGVHLPPESGFEVLAWLKERENFPRPETIVYAERISFDDLLYCQQLGAKAFLLRNALDRQLPSLFQQFPTAWTFSNG